jgi:hypothetical protein
VSAELHQASAAALDAHREAERLAVILAAVQAAQQTTPAPHSGCSCTPARPRRSGGELAVMAAGACACVGVATAALLAVALAAVSLGIGAVVLYLLWRQISTDRKGTAR